MTLPLDLSTGEQDAAGRAWRSLKSSAPPADKSMHLSNLRPKNKSVRAACETCRKKKSKCTGERPQCQPCVAHGTDCHYETSAAETHSQARKRKYDDLQSQASILQELYTLLSMVPEEQSCDIVRKMRAGAEPESLLRYLKNGDMAVQHAPPDTSAYYEFPHMRSMPDYLLFSGNTYLRSPIYNVAILSGASRPQFELEHGKGREVVYKQPYHHAKVADQRLEDANVSRWTTVISDNQLFANLLNAYFLHAYSAFPAFQKDLFLDDLVSGQTRFCSKLLVNSILAHACHCYRPLINRANHWTSQSLAYRFVVEAKRLWDIEDHAAPDITTIQAAIVLNVTYNANGTDRIGSTLLQRAVHMAQELDILANPSRADSSAMACARQFTAWSLYIWQVMHGYYFCKAPLIREPPAFTLPDPDIHGDWYGEIWLKFPGADILMRANFPHNYKAWAELRHILNSASIDLFDRVASPVVPGLSWGQVQTLHSTLEAWHRSLPGCLQPDRVAFPSHLRLHMEYYSTLYSLYQTQKDGENGPASPPLASSAMSILSLCSPEPPPSITMPISPRSIGDQYRRSLSSQDERKPQNSPRQDASNFTIPDRIPRPVWNAQDASNLSTGLPKPGSFVPYVTARSTERNHPLPAIQTVRPSGPEPLRSIAPAATATGQKTGQTYSDHSRSLHLARQDPAVADCVRRPNIPLLTMTLGKSVREVIWHCIRCLETLVRFYYLRHGFDHYDSFLIYFLTMLGNAAIDGFPEAESTPSLEALRATIALCLKGVHSQGRNFYLASILAQVLIRRIRADDMKALAIHGDLPELDENTDEIQADQIRAEWPIPIGPINEDRTKTMIDTLVQNMQELGTARLQ